MTEEQIFYKAIQAYGLDKRPFELRFLKGPRYGIMYGYFDDPSLAYNAVKDIWRNYTCYFTLQDINPSIVSRCTNHLEYTKKVTADVDIRHYRYLHIDIDPVRPSGIQSTNEESQYALERAKQIYAFLGKDMGFPNPLVVNSGNGTTLDYRIKDLQANSDNKQLVGEVLKTLACLFSDDKADVDVSVYNPARIIKIPGTISAKGSNTAERPYRFSKIMKEADSEDGLTKCELQQLADLGKELICEQK